MHEIYGLRHAARICDRVIVRRTRALTASDYFGRRRDDYSRDGRSSAKYAVAISVFREVETCPPPMFSEKTYSAIRITVDILHVDSCSKNIVQIIRINTNSYECVFN